MNGKTAFPTYDSSPACIQSHALNMVFLSLCFSPDGYEMKIRLIEADVNIMGVDDDLLYAGNCQALDICNR